MQNLIETDLQHEIFASTKINMQSNLVYNLMILVIPLYYETLTFNVRHNLNMITYYLPHEGTYRIKTKTCAFVFPYLFSK